MSVPRNNDARRYYRAAWQRMDDGELILNRLQRPLAAIYLAGYASECILKALLLNCVDGDHRGETLRQFHGARGHDLEWLRAQLKDRGIVTSKQVSRELTFITTNLVYGPSL